MECPYIYIYMIYILFYSYFFPPFKTISPPNFGSPAHVVDFSLAGLWMFFLDLTARDTKRPHPCAPLKITTSSALGRKS